MQLGVTGEDLLRERGEGVDDRVMLLRALGFGYANLVVAAPQSWIDVETMADIEEVAHLYLARTGSRFRVATKYAVQTRAFFARHGVADYRIVESLGATEGPSRRRRRAGGRHHLQRRDPGRQQPEDHRRRPDAEEPGPAGRLLKAEWTVGQLEVLRRFLSVDRGARAGKGLTAPDLAGRL